jgi:hypothetical protein
MDRTSGPRLSARCQSTSGAMLATWQWDPNPTSNLSGGASRATGPAPTRPAPTLLSGISVRNPRQRGRPRSLRGDRWWPAQRVVRPTRRIPAHLDVQAPVLARVLLDAPVSVLPLPISHPYGGFSRARVPRPRFEASTSPSPQQTAISLTSKEAWS